MSKNLLVGIDYILWKCPLCRKLIALERKDPKQFKYCSVNNINIICPQVMPNQKERDILIKEESYFKF